MRQSMRVLSLLLACTNMGCGGYFPMRWPNADLWTRSIATPPVIGLPSTNLEDYPGAIHKEQITVAALFLNSLQTVEVFHANLVRNGVQPLLLIMHNESEQPYLFRKADVDPHYIPAARAARLASVHPTVTATRTLYWLTMLLPGLLFESLVEPLTTLDFPGMEEAARRPPAPNNRRIREAFLQHEVTDGEIEPNGTRAGIIFIHPQKLGGVIPVTLINAHTRQPVVVDIPTPAPVYTESREYPQAYEKVWSAVVKTAADIHSWHLTSTDQSKGLVTAKTGVHFWKWSTVTRMTITVNKISDSQTRVTLESTLRHTDTTGLGAHAPTIDQFFNSLDTLFPAAPQRKEPVTSSSNPTGQETPNLNTPHHPKHSKHDHELTPAQSDQLKSGPSQ